MSIFKKKIGTKQGQFPGRVRVCSPVTTPLTYALRALKFFQAVSTAVIDVYVDLQNIVLQLKSNTDFNW